MHDTLVIDVVGLTPALLKHAPHLQALSSQGALRTLRTVTPAVTCTVQSTLLTGALPSAHGIVANGWYFRDLAQVWFWRQSNRLVQAPKIWELAKQRDAAFTCAKLFWWYNMYAAVDWSVTPRPMYTADGRKLPDVYAEPPELRAQLNDKLGMFPLFNFWGPRASIVSSQWIVDSSIQIIEQHRPTLSLVYLPHLDYDLQRFGPDAPEASRAVVEIDRAVEGLLAFAERRGLRVVVLSEYGITGVSGPVHINRALRSAGLLRVRSELGYEQLDPGASEAFAVADHQVAHVYVKNPARIKEVRALVESLDGVEAVWGLDEKRAHGLDHERSGELVVVSRADRWFSYYFWLDDARAPDYARTVDIHAKPGYDPVELFVDPKLWSPTLTVGRKLAARKLGFRTLLDVIPLDGSLVKGSHGRITDDPEQGPVFISNTRHLVPEGEVEAVGVRDILLRHIFDD